jgi:mersacidin/lichenicidin family type 2 lantibiotic
MSTLDIIRAWKDEEYRLSLDETERTLLPAHPAGLVELTDADLELVAGGNHSSHHGSHHHHHHHWHHSSSGVNVLVIVKQS